MTESGQGQVYLMERDDPIKYAEWVLRDHKKKDLEKVKGMVNRWDQEQIEPVYYDDDLVEDEDPEVKIERYRLWRVMAICFTVLMIYFSWG